MLGGVDSAQCRGSLAHQALLYGSEEEFLGGLVPFIRDGLQCGDLIYIATTDSHTVSLRDALGADFWRVTVCEGARRYGHPGRALAELHHTVQVATLGGQRLRMIREPLWSSRAVQEGREWARQEALVNTALAVTNAALVCAYDTRVVDGDVVFNVARTHPELMVGGGATGSQHYIDPVMFNAECSTSLLAELPPPTLWLRFRSVDQLVTLRAFATSHAIQAGAAGQSAARFVQAVDEIATNAIEHGGGSGVLQIWVRPDEIVCEVSDTGAGLRDPLAGYLPPSTGRAGGCGLWLARQLSDLVELHSDLAGTTVRLHLALP